MKRIFINLEATVKVLRQKFPRLPLDIKQNIANCEIKSNCLKCTEIQSVENPECITCWFNPNLFNHYKPIPVNQKINMQTLINSNVDVEFQSEGDGWWVIGKLSKVLDGSKYPYFDNYGESWSKCRVRENHWHSWNGEQCPLPPGLMINLRHKKGSIINNITDYTDGSVMWDQFTAFYIESTKQGWEY